jgi:hypothetical protein
MEDVVAIRFRDGQRGEACIFTWGRIFDPVDPSELLTALKRVLPAAGYREAAELRVCNTLAEASGFEYFYEALIHWAALVATEPIHDDAWRAAQREDDALRRSIYRLGRPVTEAG